MFKHPVRKAMGLTVLYSIIIIGIFVLQFRNESVILRNIGQLRVSLANTQDADGNLSLKNSLQASFKGISFTADDVHPLVLMLSGDTTPKPLALLSWEQPNAQSFKFNFTFDTSLVFTVSDTSSKASLSINAQLPKGTRLLSLYYKPVSGYSVTDRSRTRQLFSSKNISYTMSAAQIEDTTINFTPTSNIASYNRYDSSKAFTFASIPADSVNATAETFEQTVKKYRADLLAATEAALADASVITENAVTAYVAESASQSRYTEAVEAVPDSFKKGSRRTYFSSPYFNSLVAMNPSLTMVNDNFAEMINNAVSAQSLDVFATDYIEDYILRSQKSDSIQKLLELPLSLGSFEPNIAQATGILKVYLKLAKHNSQYASVLSGATDKCIDVIANNCSISSDSLTLTNKGEVPSLLQTVETGRALIEFGKLVSNNDYCSGGYMLINTAMLNSSASDLRTMAELYPLLVPANTYYPHTQFIYQNDKENVWAWTCASNITYTENTELQEANITVSFKQGESHYIILKGIKPFSGIEIYGLSFHTDPRFESYNSSGYAYDEKSHTLFLKSRHKVSNEKIRLFFRKNVPAVTTPAPAPAQTPAVESSPAPSETPEETSSEETEPGEEG